MSFKDIFKRSFLEGFTSMEITTMTTSDANQYTVVLAVIPAVVAIAAGIYVMIRRKYA